MRPQSLRFFSDNTATACPEILAAIHEANHGLARAYGDDEWTLRLDAALSAHFGTPVRAFAVTTGTAANSLALATLSPPYGAIFAHHEAHIAVDECGAPGFFSGGAQLELLPGDHGRLDAETVGAALEAHPRHLHSVQPAALSLTQATELGTVYRPADVARLSELAHRHGLKVHMDGARFANALAFLGCDPGDATWRAGVDVLSFGATKNGALTAEAVVFFDPALVRDFELRRKRAGHLLSKSRYVAAQLLAYLDSGIWKRNADRTNRLAARIGVAAGAALLHPVEANEVFVKLGAARRQALRAAGFEFYDWGAEAQGDARFVVSWDQPEQDVHALCEALARG
ncbi:MAG TPA: beta-eliminating lyase-related protein [Steroidobacteraceae bacterium]|nr:beta-eliminating lyase-related protein [Steroidobacteraceae bacterium]